MKKTKIIIHCSDSEFGDAEVIDRWHRERGWSGIGYHFVITNGVVRSKGGYKAQDDGVIQEGRPVSRTGAHCKGLNRTSIGICLIGKHHFTGAQLWDALPKLLGRLMVEHDIKVDRIYGHCEFSSKTCPNISPELIVKIADYAADYAASKEA